MVHEIKDKNLFELSRQSAREIGHKTIFAFLFFAVFVVIITVTFLLSQQRQNIIQSASYDASTRTFTDTFDGAPATPQPFTQIGQNNWDVQIHTRGEIYQLSEMDALHGMDCGAPPATHHLTGVYEDSVFTCRNHIMTAINSGSYGVIYLTPNSMVDFSNGEATVNFELSTEKMSSRDWWDITVSPFLDTQALPLRSDLSQGVDLQNPNLNSLVITTDNGEGSPNLKVLRTGTETDYPNHFFDFRQGITPGTNEMATRQKFVLTISKTRVKFERLASPTATALLIFDKTIPSLNWSQGVVQFGHHSYNPTKEGAGLPATWHWDAFTIQPATPFTMIKANKRFVDQSNQSITFNSPAPANSYLRFSGYCSIKVDGVQAQKMTSSGHAEHMSSYMMPIAAGKQNFTFVFAKDDWFFQDCIAKDFAIWSTTVSGTPQPTIPANTPTLIPNTPTPSPTTQATLTPTRIPTPIPQSVLNINPPTGSFNTNQTFTSDIRINTNGQSVNGVETTVSYPAARLEVVSVANGSSFEIEAEKTLSTGSINLAYGTTTPKTGTHTLATVTFKAISAGTAAVTLSNSTIADSATNSNVFASATGATYTIIAPTPTPTRTPTPTPTPIPTATPTPIAKLGDINNSGKVDIQDLSYLLSKWGTNDSLADLNKDAKVNTLDLSVLLSNWGI